MAGNQQRPSTEDVPHFYRGYIARVPDGNIVDTLERQIEETVLLFRGAAARADHAYAPGKWTVKQVAGHLADSERIFAERALRVARGDGEQLRPFDEEAFVAAAGFEHRSLESIVQELLAARRATVELFRGLPPEAWSRRGTTAHGPLTARALAWITAGHELHHVAILRERYLA